MLGSIFTCCFEDECDDDDDDECGNGEDGMMKRDMKRNNEVKKWKPILEKTERTGVQN